MSDMDFLLWVRGPAFDIAVAVFCVGVVIRLLEILLLGRNQDFSEARASGMEAGLKTILTRSKIKKGMSSSYVFTQIIGYTFHLGFFVSLLFFIPHIELFRNLFGISWPGLPTPIVDLFAVLGIGALIAALVHRLTSPVLRFLSTPIDYLVWTVTFLPLLTGYMTYHHLLLPYQQMLAWHILSVELLLVVFPFTKLMHAFTLFMARWYNGAIAGRKGVES